MHGHAWIWAPLACLLVLTGCARPASDAGTATRTVVIVSDPVAETEDEAEPDEEPASETVTVVAKQAEEEPSEPIAITDYESLGSVVTYDADGAETGRTVYAYDEDGNVAALMRYVPGTEEPSTITFTYTPDGIMASATGDGVSLSQRVLERDRSGMPVKVERTDGVSGQTYEYDITWREDGSIESISAADQAGSSRTFAYAWTGRAERSPEGAYVYTYDDAGRVVGIGPDEETVAVSYTYDDAGRVETRTQDHDITTYRYDAAGNPIAEYVNGTLAKTYAYVDVAPSSWTLATSRTNAASDLLNVTDSPERVSAAYADYSAF